MENEKPATTLMEDIFERDRSTKLVMTGGVIEGFVGAAAIILALVGFYFDIANVLAAVAVLVIGTVFLYSAGIVGVRFSQISDEIPKGRMWSLELRSGMIMQIIGGLGGILLGIMALQDVASVGLCSVAVLLFGITLLISSGALASLNWLPMMGELPTFPKGYGSRAVWAATGLQLLVGAILLVLGLLALANVQPLVLNLVAILLTGISLTFSGTALCERMFNYEPRLAA